MTVVECMTAPPRHCSGSERPCLPAWFASCEGTYPNAGPAAIAGGRPAALALPTIRTSTARPASGTTRNQRGTLLITYLPRKGPGNDCRSERRRLMVPCFRARVKSRVDGRAAGERPELVGREAERRHEHDRGGLRRQAVAARCDEREQEDLVQTERQTRDEERARALAEPPLVPRLERPPPVPEVVAQGCDDERDGRGGEVMEPECEERRIDREVDGKAGG